RHLELVSKSRHVRRYHPEILGDKRQSAERPQYCFEKGGSRTRHPLAGLGGRCSGGDVPRGRESPEMIQANEIDVRQQRAEAVDLPAKTGRAQGIPGVTRLGPQLSLSAEGVARA